MSGSRRSVWLLVLCKGTVQTIATGQITMAALIGHSLALDKSLATLPVAIWMTGTMVSSLPAAIVFRRFGRRSGFVAGTLLAVLGLGLAAAGVWLASFSLFVAAALPYGLGFGLSQYYRFAAAEVAEPAFRPKAVSYVMAGGVAAAILGPEIVRQTKDLFGPVLFVGSYLALGLLMALNLLWLALADLPPPPPPAAGTGRPVGAILRDRRFVAAAGAAAAGYGAMNLIMTSTPIEMMLCGFAVSDSARVIQWHAVAMFAPSFVTGDLIRRFGHSAVIVAGAALTALCAAVGVHGESFAHFVLALVFLGLGWNLMFVAGSALQAEGWSAAERAKAQALNDLIVFSVVAATAFGSGALHHRFGWTWLNLGILPALLAAAGAVPVLLRERVAGTQPPSPAVRSG